MPARAASKTSSPPRVRFGSANCVRIERQAAELVQDTCAVERSPMDGAAELGSPVPQYPAKRNMPGEWGLRSAVGLLSQALPGRFSAEGEWSRELAESTPRWSGLLMAVAKQDASSLAALPALPMKFAERGKRFYGRSPGWQIFSISGQASLWSRNGRNSSRPCVATWPIAFGSTRLLRRRCGPTR